ncbi:ATP-dependent protease ATP-binding subunit [Hyaloraphidium curvatum]|nr:ATP-dependent protease ATP-binding subunit [Hyaloraphidium curvatum]
MLSVVAEARAEEDEGPPEEQSSPPPRAFVLNPRIIRGQIDQHVIGQERMKRVMATAVYNHYVRVETNLPAPEYDPALEPADFRTYTKTPLPRRPSFSHAMNRVVRHDDRDRIVLDKSNVLLLGPTGCGKTLIAKTTADLLQVPFSLNDATPFTQAGYVGEDVEACIARLLQAADYDIARAQRGVVYIDEIDKLAKRADTASLNQRDVSGEGVQQGLLRMLEGTVVNVNVRPNAAKRGPMSPANGEVFSVDTSNILFVLSGAFVGLDKIVHDRLGKKGSIGFGAEVVGQAHDAVDENILDYVEPEDLVKFGLIPEFVGRLPIVASARALTVDELTRILTEPKNAILRQYAEIFTRNGIELRFTQDALKEVAIEARKRKTGARGLRRLIEQVLGDAMYETFGDPGVRLVWVDAEAVRKRAPRVFSTLEEAAAALGDAFPADLATGHNDRARRRGMQASRPDRWEQAAEEDGQGDAERRRLYSGFTLGERPHD